MQRRTFHLLLMRNSRNAYNIVIRYIYHIDINKMEGKKIQITRYLYTKAH